MQLDFDPAKPIYLQIVNEIKRAIARGELPPGAKVPSQRELAQQTNVNPNTVQRAYQEMERIQLVETLRGQGTFVRRDPEILERIRGEMAQDALQQFIHEMSALGFGPDEIRSLVNRALRPDAGGDGDVQQQR